MIGTPLHPYTRAPRVPALAVPAEAATLRRSQPVEVAATPQQHHHAQAAILRRSQPVEIAATPMQQHHAPPRVPALAVPAEVATLRSQLKEVVEEYTALEAQLSAAKTFETRAAALEGELRRKEEAEQRLTLILRQRELLLEQQRELLDTQQRSSSQASRGVLVNGREFVSEDVESLLARVRVLETAQQVPPPPPPPPPVRLDNRKAVEDLYASRLASAEARAEELSVLLAEGRARSEAESAALRGTVQQAGMANSALSTALAQCRKELEASLDQCASQKEIIDTLRLEAADTHARLMRARNGKSATVARAASALGDLEGQVVALTAALEMMNAARRE